MRAFDQTKRASRSFVVGVYLCRWHGIEGNRVESESQSSHDLLQRGSLLHLREAWITTLGCLDPHAHRMHLAMARKDVSELRRRIASSAIREFLS